MSKKPVLEFFGHTANGTFAGHVYFQHKPIAAAIIRGLPPADYPPSAADAPTKQAGRPKSIVQDITLLAHETLIKKCNPGAHLNAATVRMVALEVIAGKKNTANPNTNTPTSRVRFSND